MATKAGQRQEGVTIETPRSGDVLNRHDGRESPDGLVIELAGSCRPGSRVTINGTPARTEGGRFAGEVLLTKRRNRIRAEAAGANHAATDEIVALWDWQSFKRYRFSVDDNIMFLKDLSLAPERYRSLFDHWYLAFWRRMHEEFGANIHLNIYYQTEGLPEPGTTGQGFDLTQMPDKWREEWEENAPWLHLSFHALADKPDWPYRNATYTEMAHDLDLVMAHIRRFAGNEVTSRVTTVHWAACPRDAVRALRDRGVDVLIGLFNVAGDFPHTGYYFDQATCRHLNARDYFHDPEADVTFVACDLVVNSVALEEIVPALERQAASPHTGELVELLIHEQYFREDLPQYYQPDMQERVARALQWVAANGYQPVFWGEGFCGNRSPRPTAG